ncbi:hypothetical protein AURDEDRAFT_76257 [Auricularia subglabra TFB-10046 SS5]|uniref:Uncharacterized protein n=1 Tax=Auricularia subglabra (strain TFB-10046 / SS5) TaxID=717982 RepID=J0WR10_AURST|nr:hypothetical protein AURDEDRAFT_76257 [Auricularia subglabra TFB-10046 SS5]
MPQIRARPQYPGLRTDGKVDRNVVSGADGIGCSKYYAEYGQKGYTGGVVAFWCTHGICYGFHCVPEGEGRNDAFSAMYTRWPKAPRVVIYDFACALAPYCMTREAEFFKDTVFLIDKFHSSGHKACSPACFASNYVDDPEIRGLNTSAAEFGNSGLKRIRLPVRYMTQGHAILYIHRYLSLWNRLRRVKLSKKGCMC